MVADIRSPNIRVPTPELNRQEDHEEGMGAQIGRVRKVGVERWRPDLLLHQREPWCFPAHDGYQAIAQTIPPFGQSAGVCSAHCTY
jgi:hypothetical protein